ncbi:MAG: twin-arginine translocation pathway signal, partial [Saprospiraceae bacterium]|nr:twin-arginine translocation pathway signal [Saprospiraceae bacterium]
MLIQRRKFIKTASLATTALWVPRFLQAHARPDALEHRGKILVIVQLSGGNDGLNT